mgnify:CR=1 FL=1
MRGIEDKGEPAPGGFRRRGKRHIHAGLGEHGRRGGEVRRGESEQAPAPVFAVDDFALHAVQAAEQAAGFPDLPLMQQLTYARGADHFVVHGERIHPIDVEAFGFAELGEDFGRPGAALAEGEVVAEEQLAHVQRAEKNPAHEGFRRHGREFGRKDHKHHKRHAGGFQQCKPCLRGREARGCVWRQHFKGMRVERHGDGKRSRRGRAFTGHGKKRLMPQMDAVEIAHRHRGPLREVQRQRQIKRIGIAGDDHALLLPGGSGLQGHVDGFLEQIGRQRATGHKVVDEEIRGPLHAYALAFGDVGVHFGAQIGRAHV